jgi:hypothetical protein
VLSFVDFVTGVSFLFTHPEDGVLVGVAVLPSKRFKEGRRLLDSAQPNRRMRLGLRRNGGSDAFFEIYIHSVFPVHMFRYLPASFSPNATRIDDLAIAD